MRQIEAQGQGGDVLNVDSITVLTGPAGNPARVPTKHAMNGMARNAAVD